MLKIGQHLTTLETKSILAPFSGMVYMCNHYTINVSAYSRKMFSDLISNKIIKAEKQGGLQHGATL